MNAFIICSVFCLAACKNATPPSDIKRGYPRDLSWTVDTVYIPVGSTYQTRMSEIWGSLPSDIYTVGWNMALAGKMWHFDGETWDPVPLHSSEGGPVGADFVLRDIYGNAPDNVYAVGILYPTSAAKMDHTMDDPPTESLILHFDGTTWSRVDIFEPHGVLSVWVDALNNVWCGGIRGILCRFEDGYWVVDSLKNPFSPDDQYYSIGNITGKSSDDNILSLRTDIPFGSGIRNYILTYDQNNWIARDSVDEQIHAIWPGLAKNDYVATAYNLLLWDGYSLSTLISDMDTRSIFGTDDTDIFFIGDHGDHLYHYNGSDFIIINEVYSPDVDLRDIWTDGKEVFVVGNSNSSETKTIIFHGF